MQELLRRLTELEIDPDNPPEWEDIRRRADTRSQAYARELGHLALSLIRELLTAGRYPLLLTLFEVACRQDAGRDAFEQFPPAVLRYLESGIPPGRGITAGAVTLLTRPLCDPKLDPTSDGWVPDLPYSVRMGLDDFFLGKEPEESHPLVYRTPRLHRGLNRISRVPDFGYGLQTDVFARWMGAMNLLQDFEHIRLISEDFLEYHFQDLHDLVFNPYGGDRRPIGSLNQRERAVQCLAFWLRGAGESRRPPETIQVVRAAELVLGTLEELRNSEAAGHLPAFDDTAAWGYFAWCMEAVAGALGPGLHRFRLVELLILNLEMFSGRMAVNERARRATTDASAVGLRGPKSPGEATPLGIGGQLVRRNDPHPDDEETRSGRQWRHGLDWRSLFRAYDAQAEAVVSASGSVNNPAGGWSIQADTYRDLGSVPDLTEWANTLPPGTAFLGGYELPHSHRPVVSLVVRFADRVVIDAVALPPGLTGQPDDLRATRLADNLRVSDRHVRALQYQQSCEEVWHEYAAGRANVADLAELLCESLIRFHEQAIDPEYGVLVDEVIEGIQRQLTDPERQTLRQADLIYCPRGPLAAAVPALVGRRHRLGKSFRSITATPSLGFFAYLHQRAGGVAVGPLPRLNVASWFPVPADRRSPAHVLVSRATSELAGVTDLWLAADSPMATVARATRMSEAGDWSLVFAHGQNAPTSVQLADGLFPIDLPPCETPPPDRRRGGSVLFLLSCVAGRMTQTAPFVDSFGSITDEVLLSFCLTDRLERRPSLVGSFTQVVEAHAAVDLGIDLVRLRLASHGEGPAWSQFARVLQRLVKEELESSPAARLLGNGGVDAAELSQWARSQPMDFLRLYARLHFRLIGCEPRLSPP
jgi:hypothetical protein